jgi:hypothetical protein
MLDAARQRAAMEDSRASSCSDRLDAVERAGCAAHDSAVARFAAAESNINAVREEQQQARTRDFYHHFLVAKSDSWCCSNSMRCNSNCASQVQRSLPLSAASARTSLPQTVALQLLLNPSMFYQRPRAREWLLWRLRAAASARRRSCRSCVMRGSCAAVQRVTQAAGHATC